MQLGIPTIRRLALDLTRELVILVILAIVASVAVFLVFGLSPMTFIQPLVERIADCSLNIDRCPRILTEDLLRFVPLLMAALGFSACFRMGYFNIGIEGQFAVGMVAAALGVHFVKSGDDYGFIASALTGGGFALVGVTVWGILPYLLSRGDDRSAIVSNLVFNALAIPAIAYSLKLTGTDDKTSQTVQTIEVIKATFFSANLSIQWIAVVALITALLIVASCASYLINRTRPGLLLRLEATNWRATQLLGHPRGRFQSLGLMIGFVCIAVGCTISFLAWGRGSYGYVAGLGFDAIMIAILGNYRVSWMAMYGFFIILLRELSTKLQMNQIAPEAALIFQGFVLLIGLCLANIIRRRLR
jgi:simple sugar transport system permease protein